MSLEGINRDEDNVIDSRLYSSPETAQKLLELRKQYPDYPFHQKSATQAQLARESGLPEDASLEDVLEIEDRAWRRSVDGPIVAEDNERRLQKVNELHQQIVKERGFPEESTALDIISAEKEAGGYVMRMGKWVSREESGSID